MAASSQTLDFNKALGNVGADEVPLDPVTGRPLVLTKKQIKRRALRQVKKKAREHRMRYSGTADMEAHSALEKAYKPMDEWDEEELARGRPRAIDGTFRGRPPVWVSRAMHETAIETFRENIRGRMRVNAIAAVEYLQGVLGDDSVDEKGRPNVSASTKTQAAMFLVEHLLGKPKQEVSADISVKLQGVLAQAMVVVDPRADEGPTGATEAGQPFQPTPLSREALDSIAAGALQHAVRPDGSRVYDADSSPHDPSNWQEDDDADDD